MFPFSLLFLGKAWTPLSLTAMGLIVPILFLYKDGFGIKQPVKEDLLLNKETELNLSKTILTTKYLHYFCILFMNEYYNCALLRRPV